MSNIVFSPFTQATSEVLKLMLDLDVTTSAPKVCEELKHNAETVAIVIGLTGDLSGNIVYRFHRNTMLEMVQIMSGMEMDKVDEFVMSAIGEIANIISGNALIGLSQEQVTCDITPPRFMTEGETLVFGEKPIVSAVIQTSLGDIELDFQI